MRQPLLAGLLKKGAATFLAELLMVSSGAASRRLATWRRGLPEEAAAGFTDTCCGYVDDVAWMEQPVLLRLHDSSASLCRHRRE